LQGEIVEASIVILFLAFAGAAFGLIAGCRKLEGPRHER
jgi:hypothetical protein